jgi:hypothetical protein
MTFETAAAEIASLLDTPLVENSVVGDSRLPDTWRVNISALTNESGEPRHDLSGGERALVSLALDVHRGTGFVRDLCALDRARAIQVCSILTQLFQELSR